jgi:hypothetical protein
VYIDVQVKAAQPGPSRRVLSPLAVRDPRPNFMLVFYSEGADACWVMPSLGAATESASSSRLRLTDELTAAENVELPLLLDGRSPRFARRRAADLLERIGLADRTGFLPSSLSGGQRLRVARGLWLANRFGLGRL